MQYSNATNFFGMYSEVTEVFCVELCFTDNVRELIESEKNLAIFFSLNSLLINPGL